MAVPDEGSASLLEKGRYSIGSALTLLLIFEVCGLCLLQWPLLFNFRRFGFWDWGTYLVAQHLLQRNYLPISDFGWQYGLLPLLVQEMWFRVAGTTPIAFIVLSLPFTFLFAFFMRGFSEVTPTRVGQFVMLLAFPSIIMLGADLPHVMEPALLSLGLALQAEGKREQALALTTAAAFTKPAMAYLYGAVLMIFIAVDLHRAGRLGIKTFTRKLLPAVYTGLVLAFVLSARFGPLSLIKSLFPFSGAEAYRLLHLGWSGVGRELLYFNGAKATYYVGTPVTFWLCATIYVIYGALFVLWMRWQDSSRVPANSEIVLTCAVLHLGFLGLFYGYPSSWVYYAYILVIGVIAISAWNRRTAQVAWGLCALAAVANYTYLKSSVAAWRTMEAGNVTAGLYALPAESGEWERVETLVGEEKPAVITGVGGVEVLFPWISEPVGAFFVPGVARSAEIARKVRELELARAIIVPTMPESGSPIRDWPGPEFRTALNNARLAFKGAYFEVYLRDEDVGSGG